MTRLLALFHRSRRFVLFLAVGAVSTVCYFVAYNLLRLVWTPAPANAVAVFLSICVSFAGNRRYTFADRGGRRGRGGWTRQFAEFGAVVVLTLLVSNAALALLAATVDTPGRLAENAVLAASVLLLVVVRYWLINRLVFAPPTAASTNEPPL